MIEHITVCHMMTSLVGFDNNLGHHQRRAAHLKEIVSSSHLVQGQDACKDIAEQCFYIPYGSHIIALLDLYLRCGKGTTVHLLILVQRNSGNLHGCSRHHIRRLALTDKGIQRLDIKLLVTHHVCGNKLTAVGVVESLHGGILDVREFANHRFHLLQLNAEATDLHLTIAASYELDITISQVAHHIAGTVASLPIPIDIGIGRLLRQVRLT